MRLGYLSREASIQRTVTDIPSEGIPPSLYYSTKASTLREQLPDISIFRTLSDESRLIVSEPLGELAEAWNEVPASAVATIRQWDDDLHPFKPRSG